MRNLSAGQKYAALFVAILLASAALTAAIVPHGGSPSPSPDVVAALSNDPSPAAAAGASDATDPATLEPTETPTLEPTASPTEEPTASPTEEPTASPTEEPTATPTETPTPSPKPTRRPTPRPTPRPASPPVPLPALLGSIGDSYSEAFNVAPGLRLDHPEHSWAVGTASGDGVTSMYERLRAHGAATSVADAATSGRKMSDAARQARLIVSAASRLPAGRTALVTFELGTNDLCDATKTATGTFDYQVRSAISILRAGLPRGSAILMLAVPDFDHFRIIGAPYWRNRAARGNSCAPFLGSGGSTSLATARAYRNSYNASLKRACDGIEASDGRSGRLRCRYNGALLAESNFVYADLSSVDHFHPSLTGQRKMADAAWKAGYWPGL